MKAREIMSKPAITVTGETPLKRVAQLMVEHEIALVPVVDEEGALVGIVSEADLLRANTSPARGEVVARTTREAAPGTAATAMTLDVVAAGETADVADLFPLMVERHLKGVPVVRPDGVVVGVVARRDLLRLLVRTDADVHDDVLEILDHVGEEPYSIEVVDGVVTINRWLEPATRRRIEALVRAVPGVMAMTCKE